MSTQQLSLALAPRRASPKQRPVIERLHDILKRSGISVGFWEYRGSHLLRPRLGYRTGYEPLCNRQSLCGDWNFERTAYCDREPLPSDERLEHARWLKDVRLAEIYATWGRPS
jgi:hypothetical protein